MIKIFSIKEIIQASSNILNSQNPKRLNAKKIISDKEKIMPQSKNKFIIDKKTSVKKKLILDKEVNNVEDKSPDLEKIITQAEVNQFKISNKKIKSNNYKDNGKIIDELYRRFNKKIKKNTLKLIVDLRNDIVNLDKKIISLKEKEQKIITNNKSLIQDIEDLTNIENKLKYIIKKKDIESDLNHKKLITSNAQIIELKDKNEKISLNFELSQNQNNRLADINNDLIEDINQLKIKITDDQNKLNQIEKDKSDLRLKLKGYQNLNIKLEDENKKLEKNNSELKIKINELEDKLEYFEKIKGELNIKLERNINQNNFYKQNNKELNSKLNELTEFKPYKYKYLKYKQKNSDLENMLAKIKVDEDKNLQNSNYIKELEDKIKFYQDENIRVGTELLETQKKSEILRDEVEKFENQRSNLISQINSVNDVIKDSNILTSVFENKIEPKINIAEPQNIKKKSKPDLNDQVKAIFSKNI